MNKYYYPWQVLPWEEFTAWLHKDRLPHALLLHGVEAIGKAYFAKLFAQRVYCHHPIREQPCHACKSCHLFQQGNHPDFIHITPEGSSAVIKVDQIREMSQKLQQTSVMGGYKIVLVERAETMNVAASNAFLKTLEEPAGKSLIMLTTSRLNQLLPTITSRCQLKQFHLPEYEQAKAWLSSVCPSADNINKVLEIACGAPLHAKAIIDQERLKDYREILEDFMLISSGSKSAVVVAEQWHKKSMPDLVDFLFILSHDLMKMKIGCNERLLQLKSLRVQYERLMSIYAYGKLLQFNKAVVEMKGKLASPMNLNKQMMIEDVIFSLF